MVVLKKKAFEVDVPQINFMTSVIAKTEDEIVGRTLIIDLTRFLKGRSIEARLDIIKDEGKLIGKFRELMLFPSYIRRMMRTGISYIEDSFVCKSKDGVILRIKPFLITRKKVHRKVRTALRIQCKELIEEYARTKLADEIFFEVVVNVLQRELQKRLKKIYPLSLCEIRVLKKEKAK